jgi:hypothetical protein
MSAETFKVQGPFDAMKPVKRPVVPVRLHDEVSVGESETDVSRTIGACVGKVVVPVV